MSSVPRWRLTEHVIPVKWGPAFNLDYSMDVLLVSAGHYRKKNGQWSGGGPFYKLHQSRETTGSNSYSWRTNGVTTDWTAAGVVPNAGSTRPSYQMLLASNKTYGQQVSDSRNRTQFVSAWNRTHPGSPLASMGQWLLELKELPSLPLRSLFKGIPFRRIPHEALNRVKWFSGLGSEYLNYAFGWRPFVNDLREMYHLMKTIDKRMAQIVRDNGRAIKRGTRFNKEVSTQIISGPGSSLMSQGSRSIGASAAASGGSYQYAFADVLGVPTTISGSSVVSRSVTTTRESWYSASYSYHIPDTRSWQWNARTKAALFGALPTPRLVWEIMPWSWLVDWFANVGDSLEYHLNTSALPSTVARYSYLMVTERTEDTATCQTEWSDKVALPLRNIPGGSASLSTKIVKETKLRMGATPFGLGSTYDSLSNGQYAILAALGMSRSNF